MSNVTNISWPFFEGTKVVIYPGGSLKDKIGKPNFYIGGTE
jgi:hypothetical protein